MNSLRFVLITMFVAFRTLALVATDNHAAVNVYFEPDNPRKLVVEGATYTMRVDGANGWIEKFTGGAEELIGDHPLCPIMDSGKVNGPGQFEIVQVGTQVAEVRLSKLWWTDLDADIAIVLYCYPTRVFANATVDIRGESRDLALGWYGSAKYSSPLIMQPEELDKTLSFNGANPACALIVPPPYIRLSDNREDWSPFAASQPEIKSRTVYRPPERVSTGYGYKKEMEGTRLAVVILLGATSHEALKDAVRAEAALPFAEVKVAGGEYHGYEGRAGCFTVDRSPSVDGETRITAQWNTAHTMPETPFDVFFRVRGAGKALSLYSMEGFPLPTPVQFTAVRQLERRAKSDAIRGQECWFRGNIAPNVPFEARAFVSGEPGVHLASDGAKLITQYSGQDAFSFFLQPRMHAEPSGLVIGLHDDAAFLSLMKMNIGGKRVTERLERTTIYLTGPKLINFGATYRSNVARSSIEIFEVAESQMRCYVKYTLEVLTDTALDTPDALRLFEVSSPSGNAWNQVTFSDHNGGTHTRGFDNHPDYGAPLTENAPFAAAHADSNGTANIGWMINRVTGSFSSEPVSRLVLRAVTEHGVQRVFFTVLGLTQLKAGDHLEAHFFVMPFGDMNAAGIMAQQRTAFGEGIARLDPRIGTTSPGYPRRVRVDANTIAEFDLVGGTEQTPIIVDGFPVFQTPLLWHLNNDKWKLAGEGGNSMSPFPGQVFKASDNTYSAIFLVDQSERRGHYAATLATGIHKLSASGSEISGSNGALVSPMALTPDATPVNGTGFFRSRVTSTLQVH